MRAEQLKGHLDVLLLSILSRGPSHGYAVAETLKERSRGAFALAEGTLYPALHRLEEEGALLSRWATVGGRRRRVYALTRSGRTSLKSQARGWRLFAAGVRGVLEGLG
jgi:PadR family transcriptional regulator PadR